MRHVVYAPPAKLSETGGIPAIRHVLCAYYDNSCTIQSSDCCERYQRSPDERPHDGPRLPARTDHPPYNPRTMDTQPRTFRAFVSNVYHITYVAQDLCEMHAQLYPPYELRTCSHPERTDYTLALYITASLLLALSVSIWPHWYRLMPNVADLISQSFCPILPLLKLTTQLIQFFIYLYVISPQTIDLFT